MTEKERENSMAVIGLFFDELAAQGRKGVSTPVDTDSIAKSLGSEIPHIVMASLRSTQNARTLWFDTFIGINPGEFISKTECPVLAINGDKDTQVDAKSNLDIIRALCSKADIRLMPSLNHLMQHAVTGEVAEYNEIRETISPDVLKLILDFIRKQS